MSEEINEIMELAASISDFEEWLLRNDDYFKTLIYEDDDSPEQKEV